MRSITRVMTLSLALLTASSLSAQQLREDSYRWYFGVQGGVTMFESQTQTRTSIPSAGAHALILAKRAGLQIGVEEAFGSDEASAFGDPGAPNGTRQVTFDRLRKYSATLMAFPLRQADVEPYLGVGFGILHTVNTQVLGFTTSTDEAVAAQEAARDLGSTGFGSFIGGLQARVSPGVVLFAQYQVTTSPAAGSLLIGPSHGITGGFRLSLGGAKEGIKGGGY